MKSIKQIVDRYQDIRCQREKTIEKFLKGERPYLIFQTPEGNVWGDVRSPEQCFDVNIKYVAESLNVPSDHLPVLEPWFGACAYANIYGCNYVWRDGEAPAVHYKYHNIEEIRGIPRPRWEESEVARLIVRTIKYFKSKTGDAIPIVWTDTQSASDIATLVLDATEVFAGCLLEPELLMEFMKQINEVIIEFSKVQEELIGSALIHPGHIMLSGGGFKGMSISDDNLAVASPAVNAGFNLPLDEEIGKAMGGVAIHSCGNWTHSMGMLKEKVPSCVAIDCAIDEICDPNPNVPEEVRDALAGTGINVHVRLTGETELMLETVKRLLHPDIKLTIHPRFIDAATAERNYELLDKMLNDYYTRVRGSTYT